MATIKGGLDRNTTTASAVVAITVAATDLPDGPCRAIWVGTAGNITFIDLSGNTVTNFPAQVGLNPIGATRITAATASNLWALY